MINKISDELRVDLRNIKSEPKKKEPLRKSFFFILIAIIIFLSLLPFVYSFIQKNDFERIIPEERVIFSLINQEVLLDQALLLKNDNIIRSINYLNKINAREGFKSIFKNEVGFVLLSSNEESSLPFALIFKNKESDDQVKGKLKEIESKLKQDCDSFSSIYRQMEIGGFEFISSHQPFVYSLVEDYLIIGNSKRVIQSVIDKIID